ncbi:MAG: sugar transferase [bacterium]|nr:sugar transferase [bacterium]
MSTERYNNFSSTQSVNSSLRQSNDRVQNVVSRIDRYFRRENTRIAQSLHKICSLEGAAYLHSPWKRAFDLAVAVPSSIVGFVPIAILATAKKLEDGGSMFYMGKRVSPAGDDMHILKIRTMREGKDSGANYMLFAKGKAPQEDPRCTTLGKFMREYQLEELPQLFQVILGQLSLNGIRPSADYGLEHLRRAWSKTRYITWEQRYSEGPLGLSGTNQTLGSSLKNDETRYHLDMFYANRASLNLDCYIIWRTLTRVLKLIE